MGRGGEAEYVAAPLGGLRRERGGHGLDGDGPGDVRDVGDGGDACVPDVEGGPEGLYVVDECDGKYVLTSPGKEESELYKGRERQRDLMGCLEAGGTMESRTYKKFDGERSDSAFACVAKSTILMVDPSWG